MPRTRKDKLDQVAANGRFDTVIIGGGINGIGVFRELTLQGLRVLLVERSDFCSGCSSAPSRMIHGGLRYLENGEFSLVRESLAERDRLLDNAPHFIRPLPTTVPIVGILSGLWNAAVGFLGGDGQPSYRGAVPIRIGLSIYDWLTRKNSKMPKHSFQGKKETFEQWPALNRQIRFSATYYDAWISYPERLGLELVTDAEDASPDSVALNYVTLERGNSGGLTLVDLESDVRMPVAAKVIVNATGAWVDETREEMATDGDRLVAGTKGSHLVINNPALLSALGGHMLYFENEDGRICIAFPYLERVLAGATDIRVEKVTRVRCEPEERDYILSSLRRLFPAIEIGEDDVVFSFSGIRPLPMSTRAYTGRISRGHFTRRYDGDPPQICMIGGKWTTFRAFAEQTSDLVLAEIGVLRQTGSCKLPIGGGKDFPDHREQLAQRFMKRFGIDSARADHLVNHYGTAGEAVQAHCSGHASDAPLVPGCPYTTGEIDHIARNEQVVHLGDIALRRSDLAITGGLSNEVVDALVAIAAEALGWSGEQAERERTAFTQEIYHYHGVCLTPTEHTDRSEECV